MVIGVEKTRDRCWKNNDLASDDDAKRGGELDQAPRRAIRCDYLRCPF